MKADISKILTGKAVAMVVMPRYQNIASVNEFCESILLVSLATSVNFS